jgi:hypothetical protein
MKRFAVHMKADYFLIHHLAKGSHDDYGGRYLPLVEMSASAACRKVHVSIGGR